MRKRRPVKKIIVSFSYIFRVLRIAILWIFVVVCMYTCSNYWQKLYKFWQNYFYCKGLVLEHDTENYFSILFPKHHFQNYFSILWSYLLTLSPPHLLFSPAHSTSVAFNWQKIQEVKNRLSIQNIRELHLHFIK